MNSRRWSFSIPISPGPRLRATSRNGATLSFLFYILQTLLKCCLHIRRVSTQFSCATESCPRRIRGQQLSDSVILEVRYGVANPTRFPVCGLLFPVSVNEIVPFRLVPRAEPTLVNRTWTVQDPPGCKVAPVQLSAPATTLKK